MVWSETWQRTRDGGSGWDLVHHLLHCSFPPHTRKQIIQPVETQQVPGPSQEKVHLFLHFKEIKQTRHF